MDGDRIHSNERQSDQIAFRNELLYDVGHCESFERSFLTVVEKRGRRHVAKHHDDVFDGEQLAIARHVEVLLNQVVVFLHAVGIDVRFVAQI